MHKSESSQGSDQNTFLLLNQDKHGQIKKTKSEPLKVKQNKQRKLKPAHQEDRLSYFSQRSSRVAPSQYQKNHTIKQYEQHIKYGYERIKEGKVKQMKTQKELEEVQAEIKEIKAKIDLLKDQAENARIKLKREKDEICILRLQRKIKSADKEIQRLQQKAEMPQEKARRIKLKLTRIKQERLEIKEIIQERRSLIKNKNGFSQKETEKALNKRSQRKVKTNFVRFLRIFVILMLNYRSGFKNLSKFNCRIEMLFQDRIEMPVIHQFNSESATLIFQQNTMDKLIKRNEQLKNEQFVRTFDFIHINSHEILFISHLIFIQLLLPFIFCEFFDNRWHLILVSYLLPKFINFLHQLTQRDLF